MVHDNLGFFGNAQQFPTLLRVVKLKEHLGRNTGTHEDFFKVCMADFGFLSSFNMKHIVAFASPSHEYRNDLPPLRSCLNLNRLIDSAGHAIS